MSDIVTRIRRICDEQTWGPPDDDGEIVGPFPKTWVAALLDVVDAAEQVLRAHDRAMDDEAVMDWTGPDVDVLLRDALDRLDELGVKHGGA